MSSDAETRLAAASAAASRFCRRAAGGTELLHLPIEAIHPNPASRAAGSSRRRPPVWPRRSGSRASSSRSSCVPAPKAGTSSWPENAAGAQHARPASRRFPPSSARQTTATRCSSGLVENVARENLSRRRGGARLRDAVDEFELSLGEVAERVGRSKPGVSNRIRLLELRRRCSGCSPGESSPRATPERCSRSRTTPRGPAREAGRADGMTVRAAERAAQDGGARRRPRSAPVDPALAERARSGGRRLTGPPRGSRRGSWRCCSATRRVSPSSSKPSRRCSRLRRRAVAWPRATAQEVWAILDSNQGPPPYQSGALTD